ncbi:hypothetical protein [Dethiosulfatarculus sandiegensis]|uniref:Membrane protein n=1 Tax=Dethiosulfatarculus sandiegensis TaxID=1429043 RepID=A0A0D2JRJ9_9BACT|nr:hypothetical protein [Dethiosulfatarculus sandiegensis]KIX12120.1 membrane protein [Dethiosulfatarculus sandiegensis]
MQLLSLIWGILAIVGMIVGFIPCFGSLNWLNIPFAGVGVIIGVLALSSADQENRSPAMSGLICCALACLFGLFRLIAGGGVF